MCRDTYEWHDEGVVSEQYFNRRLIFHREKRGAVLKPTLDDDQDYEEMSFDVASASDNQSLDSEDGNRTGE